MQSMVTAELISIHALREEGDPRVGRQNGHSKTISIHALREEGDLTLGALEGVYGYFYPRPPRGGRRKHRRTSHTQQNFYPRPPRGGRPTQRTMKHSAIRFLSTPSARRATNTAALSVTTMNISIHALREEGDMQETENPKRLWISIHALREEGDGVISPDSRMQIPISIHALREEGDCRLRQRQDWETNFYPRPPRGGRRKNRLKKVR